MCVGCAMIFPLLLFPPVSNMDEPRHGELCRAGQADGEEWDENHEDREMTQPAGSVQLTLHLPKSPLLLLSQVTEENIQERELMIFSFLYTSHTEEERGSERPKNLPKTPGLVVNSFFLKLYPLLL